MKTIKKNYLKFLIPAKSAGSAMHFTKLLFAAILLFGIVTADSGCKSHKKIVAAPRDLAKEKADAEAKKKKEMEEQEAARKKAADEAAAAAKKEPYDRVEKQFQTIASAPSVTAANDAIADALKSYTSADLPLLIIIFREGATVDYDKPTTVGNYLAFIKDQKKSINKVDHLEMDANGKIKQIILIKK